MDTSLIVVIIAVAALAVVYIWSRKKAARHMDDLHLTAEAKEEQDSD